MKEKPTSQIPDAFTKAFPDNFMDIYIPETTEVDSLIKKINRKFIGDFVARKMKRLEWIDNMNA